MAQKNWLDEQSTLAPDSGADTSWLDKGSRLAGQPAEPKRTWGDSDKPVKTASNQEQAWGEGDSAVPASALRKVGDMGLSVAKGVVAVPEALVGLADIPTGGRVGKFLENEGGAFGFRPKQAKEYLGGLQSDDLRDKQQQFQKADGIIDKTGVALSNPSLITNAVAESVPLMGAGAVPARAALSVAPKLGAVAAGAIGEGVVGAGSAAEGIRQETAEGLMTAGQSGLALASGAATSVFGFAGGKLAQRLGIGDVDTMLTQGAIKTAGAPSAKSIPRQVVEGAIAEGWLEELPQSVSEQVLQNLALDKPWHEGVDDAAVMGTLAGMAMGGAAAGVSGFAQDTPPADTQQPPAAPPAPPQPQAGPALTLPAPDPGVIAVGGDGTARTPAYQKPSFAGEYADVTDVVPRALAPQPADPVRAAVESAANAGGALSGAALVAIDSGVTPRQEGAFEDAPELDAQPQQINLDDITDPYDRAYYESLFDDEPASLGEPPVLSAFLQDDDNIPDFDAANNVSEEDFLRALGADEQEIQDAIATTPDRAESAPEGAALPAGPQADVTAGAPEGAGAGAAQPAGPVTDAPTNLRDALARVREQKQEAANAQAATPQAAPAAAAVPAAGPGAVEAAGSATTSTTTGVASEPQADQTQQAAAQPAQAGTAPAGQPAAQRLTDGATTENPGTQAPAAPGAQAQAQSGKTEALRQQLRDVEAKILKAAPEVMGKGGGDIEAAMKSRKVPVTLKAQRKRLVEQVRAEQAAEVKTFAPETGTLGIPRADMPQVSAQSHGGLVKHLNAQGIAHETTTVNAADLKPTQAEYSPAKVEAAKAAPGDRSVIVSSDGHVIDGHHQALAAAEDGKPVKAIVLDAPVEQALEAVKNSPSAQNDADRQTAALDGKAPAAIKNVAKPKASEAVGESSTLQAAMKAAGWTAEVAGDDNTIWIKQANKERYTALLTPDAGSMEVTVLVDAVDTQIASFKVADPKAAADAANKAVDSDVAESTTAAPASAEQRMPVQAIEPKKPATNKPRGVLAKKAEAEAKARADYFTPGNVVQGYSGHDRVIAYNPPGEDGQWSVTVRAVEKQGDAWMDKAGERERAHATPPDAKALKAGPVMRAAPTRQAESVDGEVSAVVRNEQDASRATQDFVPAPDGGLDYGEITPEMGKAMRRQAGKIRLRRGDETQGLVHIEARHLDQFKKRGFESVPDFVASVAKAFTAIYKRDGAALDVVLEDGDRGRLVVQLELAADGDFYDVKTASPIREDQFKNREPLWERAGTSAPTAGESSSPSPWGQNGVDSVPLTTPAEQPITRAEVDAAQQQAPGKPIEDFGEKIGGARKDVWAGFKDDLNKVDDGDIAAQPLSKVWPAPDYQKLIDAGMDAKAVATVRALRDEVPAKPRSPWKVKRWAEQVKTLRSFANDVMDGKFTAQDLQRMGADKDAGLRGALGRIELYELVGHGKSLEGMRFSHHHYSLYKGRENVSLWVVEKEASASAFSNWPTEIATGDTKEQALAAFKEKYDSLDLQSAARKAAFDIFSERGGDGFYVGKKIGRNYAKLEGPFKTVKEAREYRQNNMAALEAKLEKYKEIPRERADVNQPRVGVDMRNGQDVTPQMFGEVFGFRGVEFGNYVEQKRRQKDLNDAFDALMDMAAVLDIPAKAISLNGKLGLAFGARGSGGVNPAAAHYEPGSVVINLTKKAGAGSLGHEWWHALDNYFAKQRATHRGTYMTTGTDVSLAARGKAYFYEGGVRQEMVDAFGAVVSAINRTAMKERSSRMDAKRTKEYWTTGEEMAARAFESYLIAKLQDQSASNDYLANVVSQKTWDAMASLGMANENSYPYPTAAEVPAIRAGFDHFFQTVETKETEGSNVAMFSRTPATKAAYEARIDALYAGGKPLPHGVRVLDRSDMLGLLGMGSGPVHLVESKVEQGRFNHGLSADDWKKVPGWLDDPAMVFDSETQPGRLVFIAPEMVNGSPVRMIVDPRPDGQGVNLLVNAYDAERNPFQRWERDGLMRYFDQQKAPSVTGSFQPRLTGLPGDRGRNKILTEKHLGGYRRANTPAAFMGQLTPPADSNARNVATQLLVDGLKAKWTRAPEIIVARNMQDTQIPQAVRDYDATLKSQGASGEARGFIYKGKVYLLSDELKGPQQTAEVLFHEVLGHYGLRGAFGDSLDTILQQIGTMRRRDVVAKAREYGLFDKDALGGLDKDAASDAQIWAAMSAKERLSAAEEVLAEMAQAQPNIGFVQRAIAAIRNWLRSNVPGFKSLRLTDADIIQKYLLPARRFVTRSKETGAQSLERAMMAFSRGTNEAMTNNDVVGNQGGRSADDTTPGDLLRKLEGTQVVDPNGAPLLVYHGSKSQIDRFDASKTIDGGLHFGSKSQASMRSSKILHPAYLYAENLRRSKDTGSNWKAKIASAKAAGYDGIVYLNRYEGVSKETVFRLHSQGLSEKLDRMSDAEFRRAVPEAEDSYIVFDAKQVIQQNESSAPDSGGAAFSRTAIGNNGDFDPANADIRFRSADMGTQSAWDAPTPTGFDDVIYKLQDKNIDLKRVLEAITKSVGKVADSINAYLKEELFHKRAAKRVADFGARELKPLMNQMRLAGLSMEDVEEYLHARHATEANAVIAQRNPGNAGLQDGGSGMTNQAADNYFAKIDPAQRKKLEAVAKNVDAIIADTRKLYVSYGLEDQAVVDGWSSMYQHYIPLMREDKEGGMGTGQGFSVKGKETKGRTGSTRKVVDVLANIASQRERLIVRGEKNRVTQALVGLAQANPNAEFWEVRSQAPTERVFDPKTGVVVDRPDPLFKSRDNVIVAKVQDAKGSVTEQMVVFNEDNPRAVRMAAAMKNLDAGNLEGLLGMSAKITRYFSAINTQYNPVFGVVNLVRDVQGAMVNLAATPLAGQQGKIAKDTMSALVGIYSDIRKTRKGGQATSQWSQLWEQMQDDGGTTGYRELFTTSADRANNLKSILNPEGWMDNKWGKFFTAGGKLKVPMSMAQKGASEIFGWLSDYNEAMENGVRLAAYKAALDKGMSREQAASLAKNLTVNFNRKGQVGQQAGAVYAFFNAAMQGTARIGQTLFDIDGGDISTLRLSKTGKAVVYGGVTLGAIQALALAGAGFDDEDPPEFVRERSLIIPTGGKTYVAIPMPLGLHVIPGIGRHAAEFALSGFDKPAKRAVSMVGMFADAFNPIGNAGLSMQTIAPTALDPLAALTENKDWTGKPIARVSSNRALPGHTQWKDTATGFSKVVAEAINWVSGGNEYVAGALSPTPDQIDYLLAQVGGGVAREAAKVQQTITTALSGEALPTHKVPLLGRFVGNAASQASQGSAFYANLNKLNELETEIKGLRKDGRFDEAAKLARENPQATMIVMANRAERDVQKLRRDKRELIAKDASREEVRAKEEQITAVMMRLNEAAERRKAQANQ